MTVTDQLFNRDPAPRLGKPPHVWTGVSKRQGDSADIKAHPWQYRCPAPMCFYQRATRMEKDALRIEEEHKKDGCPWFGGGTTTLSWGIMSESFILPIWKLLDECMDIIRDEFAEANPDGVLQAKQQARAYANTLAILMPPFFRHPDEIAREALVRWQKRQAGEDYETPGIGRLRFKPPSSTLEALGQRNVQPAPTKVANSATRHNLNDKEVEAIKFAMSSGMFKAVDLAKTYGVSEAVIKEVSK